MRISDASLDEVRDRGFCLIEGFLSPDELDTAQQALWLHFPKPEEFFADPSEPAYIRQCRDAGLPMSSATNDVLPGITAVSQALRAGMTVDPSCVGLLGEIPGYVWKRDRATGNTIDVPVKVGDDGCDALRYATMGLADGGWGSFYRSEIEKLRAGREEAA